MTILDIILIVIAVALLVLVVVMKTNNKRLVMRAVHRMDTRYTEQLEKSNSEVRRITALYDELRSRTSASQAAATSNVAQIIDIERLSAEQKKLEAEQEELSNRNRQLWDMSVSIEKERQHIQILKNEIEGKHRDVTSSIQYAKLIQDAVLPSLEILRESFQDGFLFWRPRDIVSGDFYWMKRIGDTVIFTVADCTGHGVPGAFMSMLGVAFLNEICVDFNLETHPAQILEQLRHKVITTLKQKDDGTVNKDGMDICLCIFNLATMKMQFSGANNGMYHVRGSVLTEYAPVRNPIGLYPKVRQFEDHDVDIQSGDYIYMFSDGYADQFSSKSQKFTLRRFRNLFVDINAKTKVAAEQAKILSDTFDQWRGSYKQMDDVLIGGYRIK